MFSPNAADLAQPGTYLTLTNAKIDMFRGSMRLAVDGKGSVEAAPQLSFKPRVSPLSSGNAALHSKHVMPYCVTISLRDSACVEL